MTMREIKRKQDDVMGNCPDIPEETRSGNFASGIICTRLMVPENLGKTPVLSPVVILDLAGRWSSLSLHPSC